MDANLQSEWDMRKQWNKPRVGITAKQEAWISTGENGSNKNVGPIKIIYLYKGLNMFNPRNTSAIWVSIQSFGSLYLETQNARNFLVPFSKKFWGLTIFFFFFWCSEWLWRSGTPPKIVKIVEEASFLFSGPGKNPSLQAKFQTFKAFFHLGHVWDPEK